MKYFLIILLVGLIFLSFFNVLRLWGNYLFSAGRVQEALVVEPYNYLYHFAAGTALMQADAGYVARISSTTASYSRKPIYVKGVDVSTKIGIDLAVKHLKKAVKLNPSYTDALNNLAVALIIEKRYDEARRILADLKRRDARDGYGRQNLKVLEKLLSKER